MATKAKDITRHQRKLMALRLAEVLLRVGVEPADVPLLTRQSWILATAAADISIAVNFPDDETKALVQKLLDVQ